MSSLKNSFEKQLVKFSESMVNKSVNEACFYMFYQRELPEKLKNVKHFKR